MNRRHFILGSGALVGTAFAGIGALRVRSSVRGTLLSAFEDVRGDQFIGGLKLESLEVFGARVPMRAHGCAVDPRDPTRVLYFARRPGTQAFELDLTTQSARTVCETPANRHFAGHGTFASTGEWLFTPEHDFERQRGLLAVRDARTLAIAAEIDTHGIDPHEIAWSPNRSRLIVANGGILTHPRSYRRKLNLPTMDPSLCVLDAATGERLEQWRLPDHLLSIRHLAVASSGAVAVGLQYEGAADNAPSVAALYEPGRGLHLLPLPDEARKHSRGYVASIAISEQQDVIAAACPYGNGVACWSLSKRTFEGFVTGEESYGVSRLADGGLIVSQRDGTYFTLRDGPSRSRFVTVDRNSPIRWDDHWQRLEGTLDVA